MTDIVSIHIAGWLGCAAFVLMMLHYGAGLADRLKGKPPGAEIMQNVAALAAQVAELKQNEAEATRRRKDIHDRISYVQSTAHTELETLRTTLISEIAKVHDRVNQILEAVAELRGAIGVPK